MSYILIDSLGFRSVTGDWVGEMRNVFCYGQSIKILAYLTSGFFEFVFQLQRKRTRLKLEND